jgi:hypothetical protein
MSSTPRGNLDPMLIRKMNHLQNVLMRGRLKDSDRPQMTQMPEIVGCGAERSIIDQQSAI